jgi:hypothetical protein
MTYEKDHDPKGGNKGGSRLHEATGDDGSRQPDAPTDGAANANEGADPSDDIREQNPGETTTADLAAPFGDAGKARGRVSGTGA